MAMKGKTVAKKVLWDGKSKCEPAFESGELKQVLVREGGPVDHHGLNTKR
jgi:hypothetical protein